MSDRKKFDIDYQALDAAAQDIGISPLKLLGQTSRTLTILGQQGKGNIEALKEIIDRSPFDLARITELGLDTAESLYLAIKGLENWPMIAHLNRLAQLAQPAEPAPKKPRKPPLLPPLAQPFYEEVGYGIDGRVRLEELADWQGIESDRKEGTGFYRRSETAGLIPETLFRFMHSRSWPEQRSMRDTFWFGNRVGLKTADAVRVAPESEIDKLGRPKAGGRIFLTVGLGRGLVPVAEDSGGSGKFLYLRPHNSS